jgi:hypothetical protein
MTGKSTSRANLAAEVEPKLDAAIAKLAAIERRVAETSLAAALNETGAHGRLAQHTADRDAAAHEVAQLEGALRLAVQRDAAAQARAEAKARANQLADLQERADARLAKMVEVCAAIEAAAVAYTQYLDATGEMQRALPTGTIPHAVDFLMLDFAVGNGTVMPASTDIVLAGEMWKHADPARAGKPCGTLPGARAPVDQLRLQPSKIEPASEAVRRANEYLIGRVRQRFEEIDRAGVPRGHAAA